MINILKDVEMVVCNIDEEGRFGGPERRIVLVADGLTKYQIKTMILIPNLDSKKFESEITERMLWYKKLNYSRLTLEFKNLIRYLVMFPLDLVATVIFLRKHRVDLVHVNGSYQFRSAIAAFVAFKKLVWHVNDAKMHWLVKLIFRLLATKIADAFIFSSVVAQRYYFPRGFDMQKIKSAIIPPPVQIERFSRKDFIGDMFSELAAPITIVTVTGINPDKGLEYFIEAASIIYGLNSNVRFIVAAAIHDSHSKYFTEIKDRIRDLGLPDEIIQFIGFVDDIPNFLLTGDIFLYTSNTEAGPAAVWEAMAAGLPVVTTSVGAIPEYLVHGVDALIATPRDARQLAEFTHHLICNPSLRADMGRAARKTVENCLSVDAAARKHADLYREILKNA